MSHDSYSSPNCTGNSTSRLVGPGSCVNLYGASYDCTFLLLICYSSSFSTAGFTQKHYHPTSRSPEETVQQMQNESSPTNPQNLPDDFVAGIHIPGQACSITTYSQPNCTTAYYDNYTLANSGDFSSGCVIGSGSIMLSCLID